MDSKNKENDQQKLQKEQASKQLSELRRKTGLLLKDANNAAVISRINKILNANNRKQ